MSNARDLINAHLYPVLATFGVIYLAIQIAPVAQQARSFNRCVAGLEAALKANNIEAEYTWDESAVIPEALCNGGR